jgi:hypothetical protein
MALGLRYLGAIEAAGGIPVVMPPLRPEAIDSLMRAGSPRAGGDPARG